MNTHVTPSAGVPNQIRIIFPGVLSSVRAFLDGLGRFLDEWGVSGAERSAIMIAAEEIFVNVVRHAYLQEPGEIVVTLAARDREVEITISDSGHPFNPLTAAEPELNRPLEERTAGGLGLLLVRKLADGVRYERRGEANVITLTKHVGQVFLPPSVST